jgi:hypothetical protein
VSSLGLPARSLTRAADGRAISAPHPGSVGAPWHVDEAAHAPDVETSESSRFASLPPGRVVSNFFCRYGCALEFPVTREKNREFISAVAASPMHRQRLRSPSTEVLASAVQMLAFDSSTRPRPQSRPSVEAAHPTSRTAPYRETAPLRPPDRCSWRETSGTPRHSRRSNRRPREDRCSPPE